MWELWEMQFPQIFAKTEAEILQVILGRQKWIETENHAHFGWGKLEYQMILLSAAGVGLTAREEQQLIVEEDLDWGVGFGLVGIWRQRSHLSSSCPGGGMGPVWPLTWLPGHPKSCRTSWVQCCALAIPGNPVACPFAGRKGVVLIRSRQPGNSFRSGETACFWSSCAVQSLQKINPLDFLHNQPFPADCLEKPGISCGCKRQLDPESSYEGVEKQSCDSGEVLFPAEQRDLY